MISYAWQTVWTPVRPPIGHQLAYNLIGSRTRVETYPYLKDVTLVPLPESLGMAVITLAQLSMVVLISMLTIRIGFARVANGTAHFHVVGMLIPALQVGRHRVEHHACKCWI